MNRPSVVVVARAGVLLAGALVSACQPGEAPSTTYVRDIKPILDRSCTRCHEDGNIGPFPLSTYAQVYEVRELVKAAVEARTMPPWMAAEGCDEYQYDSRLSDDEIAAITRWVDEGAHEGEADATGPVAQGVNEDFSLDRVDLTMPMPVEYEPSQQSSDDYRCFVVDWPEQMTKFVTGFQVRPGNKAIVHHVIAYVAPPDRVARVAELDDAEPGPGYTCYGGPGFSGNRWLGAWAPGGAGSLYPVGTGLRVEPGSKVVLQMHYFVKGAENERDRTEIDVKLEDAVDKEAFILPFTNPLWLEGQSMLIPAGQKNVSHAFDVRVGDFFEEPFVIHTANLHMHRLATAGVTWIERQDQSIDCMLDIPRYDFDWQLSYLFTESKIVYPEDKLGIECQYDNSADNQPVIAGERQEPRDVAWGEGTGDEMCLGIFFVSEL